MTDHRQPRRSLSEAEIRALVEEAANKAASRAAEQAAEEAVRKTLLTIGMSTAEPLELQKDMQLLREWRMSVSTIKKQGIITVVGIVTAGIIGAIWLMIKGPSP